MRSSLSHNELAAYVAAQVTAYFPDGRDVTQSDLAPWISAAWPRLEHCFLHIRRKYFYEDNKPVFSHLHTDHYAMFLYLVSNTIHRGGGPVQFAEKMYYLNKALHGLDCFYSVALPEIFLFIHPVGTVLGNAHYEDYLIAYQNVGVGANENGVYPSLGKGVVLFAKTTLLGDCTVGDNSVFGACAFTINSNVPANSTVVAQYPSHRLLPNELDNIQSYFRQI